MLETLARWDTGLFYAINHGHSNPVFDWLMVFVTNDGNWRVPFALLFLGLMIRGGRTGRTAALLCIPLITISDQLSSNLIKHTFERIRPCNVLDDVNLLVGCSSSFAMPSSHAANSGAAAFHFSFFYPRGTPVFVFLGVLVAYTRPYVGVHYPFDSLVGLLVGLVAALLVQALWRLGMRAVQRLRARRAAANATL